MTLRDAAASNPRQFARQLRRKRLTRSRRSSREREWFRQLSSESSTEEAHAGFLRLKLYQAEQERRSKRVLKGMLTLLGAIATVIGIYQTLVPDLTTIRVTRIELQGGDTAPLAAGRIGGELILDLWANGRMVRRYGPAREAEIYGAPAAEVPFRWRGLDLRFRLVHYPPDEGNAPAEYHGEALHLRGRTTSASPLTLAGADAAAGLHPPPSLDALVYFTVESR